MTTISEADLLKPEQIEDAHLIAWHEAECGRYRADLSQWQQIAGSRSRRILDLGCGTGRVAGFLSELGHRVTGLDTDRRLLAALEQNRPDVRRVVADARTFELTERFDLVLAPMQLLQLFIEAEDRHRCLRAARGHLAPGGRFAAAIVDLVPEQLPVAEDLLADGELSPDVCEIEAGLLATSTPTGFEMDGAGRLNITRRRDLIAINAFDGARKLRYTTTYTHQMALLETKQFESELQQAGMKVLTWHPIAATDQHMGSLIAVAEAV